MQSRNQPRLEIADQEFARLPREKVSQSQIDGLLRRGPAEHVATDREHYDEERIEGQQSAGRDGQRVDMRFRLYQVSRRWPGARPPRRQRRSVQRDQTTG